jgi:hypothetical protein
MAWRMSMEGVSGKTKSEKCLRTFWDGWMRATEYIYQSYLRPDPILALMRDGWIKQSHQHLPITEAPAVRQQEKLGYHEANCSPLQLDADCTIRPTTNRNAISFPAVSRHPMLQYYHRRDFNRPYYDGEPAFPNPNLSVIFFPCV